MGSSAEPGRCRGRRNSSDNMDFRQSSPGEAHRVATGWVLRGMHANMLGYLERQVHARFRPKDAEPSRDHQGNPTCCSRNGVGLGGTDFDQADEPDDDTDDNPLDQT